MALRSWTRRRTDSPVDASTAHPAHVMVAGFWGAMTLYIGNAFALSMLPASADDHSIVLYQDATIDRAREYAAQPHVSCVGHADTARLMSDALGVELETRRCSIQLKPGDQLLVAQYSGPRLPEGATSLPEGATFRWLFVRLAGTFTCPYPHCGHRRPFHSHYCGGCGAT